MINLNGILIKRVRSISIGFVGFRKTKYFFYREKTYFNLISALASFIANNITVANTIIINYVSTCGYGMMSSDYVVNKTLWEARMSEIARLAKISYSIKAGKPMNQCRTVEITITPRKNVDP